MTKRRDGGRTIQEKETAPQFTLRDAGGNAYALEEALRKGPVVVAFFKISCPVCQFTFPFLERMHKGFAGAAVTFLGISQDDALDTREFLTEYGVTFPALIDDESYTASNAYGLTNVPSIFFIEPSGIVKLASIGFDREKIQAMAHELSHSGKRPPPVLFYPGESVPNYKPG
jgi:peroxiredoxin